MSIGLTLLIAAGALAVWVAIGGLDNGSDRAAAATHSETGAARPDVLTVGRWRIHAIVRPRTVGPIALSVGNLAHEDRPRSAWLTHDFIFRNSAERPARFEDTRTSALIGHPGHRGLLALDPGCGWIPATRRHPIQAGFCDAVLIRLTAEPHHGVRQSIALEKGLRGMDPLVAGTYVFHQKVRFHLGSGGPRRGSKNVRLIYRVGLAR
ncbi:MAG: hypothetical protein ACRDMH_01070 [Solirubrobacterales bacterium]